MTRERFRVRNRRDFLAACGTAATLSFAGCTGDSSESDAATTDATTTDAMATDSMTTDASAGDSPLGGHPAGVGVGHQPRFGPSPRDADGVVVAFEDPSCPRCAAFETGTVPKIRERLGDRVSFVFRGYPVVYPWGEPATRAIESAFAREVRSMEMSETMDEETTMTNETAMMGDETETMGEETAMDETAMGDARTTEAMSMNETTTMADQTTTMSDGTSMADETMTGDAPYGSEQGSVATWKLIRHYFENQSQFGEENVLELTREFLATETDLDADAVVADAESKARDDAVQADLDAGEQANVGNTTPTVFLFRDGEFRTSAKGSISYSVVESALGF